MSLAAHLEYRLRCIRGGCTRFALDDSNFCAACRPEVFELGIGAADQPPSFAPLSERLEARPPVRWSLWVLQILGAMGVASVVGIVAGMLMLILHRQ